VGVVSGAGVSVVLVVELVVVDAVVVVLVLVVLDVVELLVVVAAALVTLKSALASSAVLWALIFAAPGLEHLVVTVAEQAGGTVSLPSNTGAPRESALPMVIVVEPWTKSMITHLPAELGSLGSQAW